MGTNIKFILAKEIVSKERDRRREKRVKEDKRNFEENKKKRIRRKQNEVYNRKDFNTSFFQEVIDHMDCKLNSQKLSLASILRGKTSFSRVFFTSFKKKTRNFPW